MERVQTIEFRKKKIVIFDFSSLKPGPELQEVIDKGRIVIQKCSFNSALTLVDVSSSEFDLNTIDAIRAFALENKPYVKASAVVGATGIYNLAREAIERSSGRDFMPFEDRDAALTWLAGQSD